MKRRNFIREIVLLGVAPMLILPRKSLAQPWSDVTLGQPSIAATGGGSCATTQAGLLDATNGEINGFGSADHTWMAFYFLSTGAFTMCGFELDCYKSGSPTMNLTPYVFNVSSNLPGSALSGGTGTQVSASALPSSDGTMYKFVGLSASISATTAYFLVLAASAVDAGNYIKFNVTDGSWPGYNSIRYGADGSSWAGGSNAQCRNQPYS